VSRILVTGGAGFIGCHLVRALLDHDHQVRVLDSLEPPSHVPGVAPPLDPRADFIHGDVREPADVRSALDGVDTICHLAATGGYTAAVSRYIESNALGTARMLEVIRDERLPIRRLLVASSMAVYGEGSGQCPTHGRVAPGQRSPAQLDAGQFEPLCPRCAAPVVSLATDEDHPVRPERPYSITKFSQERLVLSLAPELDIDAAALRYFLTFGPGQSPLNPYTGVRSIFATRALRGQPPVVYEDGAQTRDFLYVSDLVDAHLLMLDGRALGGRLYNVGGGRPTELRTVARSVVEAVGREIEPELPGRYRLGDVRHIHADTTRIQALGWRPRVSLDDGIQRFVDWFREIAPPEEPFSSAERGLRERGLVRESRNHG